MYYVPGALARVILLKPHPQHIEAIFAISPELKEFKGFTQIHPTGNQIYAACLHHACSP